MKAPGASQLNASPLCLPCTARRDISVLPVEFGLWARQSDSSTCTAAHMDVSALQMRTVMARLARGVRCCGAGAMRARCSGCALMDPRSSEVGHCVASSMVFMCTVVGGRRCSIVCLRTGRSKEGKRVAVRWAWRHGVHGVAARVLLFWNMMCVHSSVLECVCTLWVECARRSAYCPLLPVGGVGWCRRRTGVP